MKKITTLTKLFTLAALLVTVSTASASIDDGKCKTKCCKNKKDKELAVAMAELEKAMNKLEAELKTVTVAITRSEVKRTVRLVRPVQAFAFASAFATVVTPAETVSVDARYRIDFADLDKEMDKVQQDMTSAPDTTQQIDFSNLQKEMDATQERLSSFDTTKP